MKKLQPKYCIKCDRARTVPLSPAALWVPTETLNCHCPDQHCARLSKVITSGSATLCLSLKPSFLLFFSFVIDILFYLFSAKRVNDSFRSFKKKYLNCLKYWCSKCHNLEEEAWNLAFKLCLQRLHFFCIAGEQLLEGTSQRWKSSPKTSLQGCSTWLKATLWREYEDYSLTCAPWASQNLSTGFSGVEY